MGHRNRKKVTGTRTGTWSRQGQRDRWTGTGYDRDRGTVTGIVTHAQRNKDRGTVIGIVRLGQRNKDRHRDRDRGTVTKDRNMNRVTQTGTEGQG